MDPYETHKDKKFRDFYLQPVDNLVLIIKPEPLSPEAEAALERIQPLEQKACG